MAIKKVRIRPEGENNYADIIHPETSADIVVDTPTKVVMTKEERDKLSGIQAGANKTTIDNTLTSTSTTQALSANQGKILNENKLNKSGDILENYREKLVTLSGTSVAVNLNNGNVFTHTLSGTTTYSISNAQSQAHSFTLIITQTGTVRTITFPASVKWQSGEIPDLSTASKTYILTFLTIDGGTTWLGMFGGEF